MAPGMFDAYCILRITGNPRLPTSATLRWCRRVEAEAGHNRLCKPGVVQDEDQPYGEPIRACPIWIPTTAEATDDWGSHVCSARDVVHGSVPMRCRLGQEPTDDWGGHWAVQACTFITVGWTCGTTVLGALLVCAPMRGCLHGANS